MLTNQVAVRTIDSLRMPEDETEQLEFFGVAGHAVPQRRKETFSRLSLQFRYDHAVLFSMAGLIGMTVIFAGGVERGKQLARSERSVLVRQELAGTPSQAGDTAPQARRTKLAPEASTASPAKLMSPAPAAAPKSKTASKLAAVPAASESKASAESRLGKSRYAVQVVTFSRPHLAKQELTRLQARGERAFLVLRGNGRAIVYVGPFPSKGNASERLATLKVHYQDCFVRTL